jgi:hypothetical protein
MGGCGVDPRGSATRDGDAAFRSNDVIGARRFAGAVHRGFCARITDSCVARPAWRSDFALELTTAFHAGAPSVVPSDLLQRDAAKEFRLVRHLPGAKGHAAIFH